MIRSDELDQLAAALSAAQAEFGAIPKDTDNKFFQSKYASLASAVKNATPIVAKHGLSVAQFPGLDEHGDVLATWLLHKSGQFICESMRLHSAPGKGQSVAQGFGSSMTYARRYSYMSVLGLVADEDTDGNDLAPEPELASAKDVQEMVSAAETLTGSQIADALAECGLSDVKAYNRVPADKVVALIKAFGMRQPQDVLDPVAPEL